MNVRLSISIPGAIIYTLRMKLIFVIAGGDALGAIVGFTAFSSFALDTGLLLQRHELGLVILYVGDSMILSPPGFLACLSPLRQAPT